MAVGQRLQPGDVVGGYRIRSFIAPGGMGSVYRATGPRGEDVALKMIKDSIARDATVRRRFAREARIAQRVDHPHVVPVLDVGDHEGVPYLAQCYLRGGTIGEKVEREGPLAPAFAVRVCEQVASGLDALHDGGMIHRDVKPANILLDDRGDAHITDFGLAKDTTSDSSALTRPGQTLGSLDYMAPEQIRAEPVTAATDVYGLACVMVTCLTEKPPFGHRHGMAVLWAHLQDTPPNPADTRPEVPRALGEAILRGLAKDPGERPQRASEFASALRAAIA